MPGRGALAAVLVLVGLFATGVGLGQLTDISWPSLPSFGGEDDHANRLRPTKVSIPAIGVRANVTPVGTAKDGSIAVPDLSKTNITGWFEKGPSPGENGAAIIVGHVDNRTGPSVFYKLHSLDKGDRIEVTRKDRKTLVFTVDSVAQYPKDKFPAGPVFAGGPKPLLRLITCGGRWVGGDTGYQDNVIVFATLRD